MESHMQEQLKLTKMYSPISGTVDEVNLKVGESAMFGGIRVDFACRLEWRLQGRAHACSAVKWSALSQG